MATFLRRTLLTFLCVACLHFCFAVTPTITPTPTPTSCIFCTPSISTRASALASLRASLLQSYDPGTIPLPASGPLRVKVSINFFNYQGISLESGRLELRVWYDLIWEDTRLQWSPSLNSNINSIRFGLDSSDHYEIWVPDVHLVNIDEPNENGFAKSVAVAYNNGTVRWSRPGTFIASCRFENIAAFPWDYPTCTLEIGSWGHTASEIALEAYGTGWSYGGLDSGDTLETGSSREFTMHRVDAISQTYESRGVHENWTVLQYTVIIKRQTRLLFLSKMIIPHILFTACSFVVFFMNPECHERITLGLLLVFLQLLSQLLFSNRMPFSGRWTAVSKITTASIYLTMGAMFESCLVCCAYWYARTIRPKPATKPGFAAKFIAMWKIPASKTGTQQDLPVLLKRQQTQAKLRTQIRAAGNAENDVAADYLRKDEKEKKLLRQQIRERKVQNRIEEERVMLQERRYRFVASRLDLASMFSFPVSFVIVLFVLLSEIIIQVGIVDGGNITLETELGYVVPISAAPGTVPQWMAVALCSALCILLSHN